MKNTFHNIISLIIVAVLAGCVNIAGDDETTEFTYLFEGRTFMYVESYTKIDGARRTLIEVVDGEETTIGAYGLARDTKDPADLELLKKISNIRKNGEEIKVTRKGGKAKRTPPPTDNVQDDAGGGGGGGSS